MWIFSYFYQVRSSTNVSYVIILEATYNLCEKEIRNQDTDQLNVTGSCWDQSDICMKWHIIIIFVLRKTNVQWLSVTACLLSMYTRTQCHRFSLRILHEMLWKKWNGYVSRILVHHIKCYFYKKTVTYQSIPSFPRESWLGTYHKWLYIMLKCVSWQPGI